MSDPVPPSSADLERFAKWAARVRFAGKFLCRTEYHPAEPPNLGDRPIVMVANHRSLADVFVAVQALDYYGLPARCLVRAKYFEAPLAGRWLRTIGCIPAGDGGRESVDVALDTLASGRPVAIMVEGKLVPPDRRDELGLGEFRPGFVEIARAADAAILPIALDNTDAIWASRGRLPRVPWRGRPTVRVGYGNMISTTDKRDEEIVEETRQAIAAMLARE